MRAVFVLTPPESKRFIAKAVAQMPEVRKAKKEGEIVIGHGSTNVYVAEEILGNCPDRNRFLSGLIINRVLCVTQAEEKPPIIRMRKGRVVPPEATMEEMLKSFDGRSVFVKGANAVDAAGNVGVFVANPAGGTIGWSYGILSARGSRLIVPVGLEKLVPSVPQAARLCGQKTLDYCQGIHIGMIPIMNGQAVTEIEAFRILFDLEAIHIGGGGVGESQGSIVLAAEGKRRPMNQAVTLMESIKGAPSLEPKKSLCLNCFPTIPSLKDGSVRQKIKHCMYQGKAEKELPFFMRRRDS